MRDVLHGGRDIDDGIVAFQHAELEVVEIEDFHLALPMPLSRAGCPPACPAEFIPLPVAAGTGLFDGKPGPANMLGAHQPGRKPCRSPEFAAFRSITRSLATAARLSSCSRGAGGPDRRCARWRRRSPRPGTASSSTIGAIP